MPQYRDLRFTTGSVYHLTVRNPWHRSDETSRVALPLACLLAPGPPSADFAALGLAHLFSELESLTCSVDIRSALSRSGLASFSA